MIFYGEFATVNHYQLAFSLDTYPSEPIKIIEVSKIVT